MFDIYVQKGGALKYTNDLSFVYLIEKYLLLNEIGINIFRDEVIVRQSNIIKTINIIDNGTCFLCC
jgi:hypothetical protein